MAENRTDSAHEQTKIMEEAAKGIQVPSHIKLRPKDIPFWKSIIAARYEWTDVDLNHAANLARCLSDIEKIQSEIDSEGDVLRNLRGTQIMNPKHTLLETLSRRSVALARMIQVHAAATIGESKDNKGKNSAKRGALKAMNNADEEDDLIARPLH